MASDFGSQRETNIAIYERVAGALQERAEALTMPELVVEVAQLLLGTPYIGASLEQASEALDFEKAAKLRDQLFAIRGDTPMDRHQPSRRRRERVRKTER